MTRFPAQSATRSLASSVVLRWLLAVACLVTTAHAAGPSTETSDVARATAPVRVGSPAWNELLYLPLRDDDALQLPAAKVLAEWQRPDEADRLRRATLLAQLRVAAGAAPLPANDTRLAVLWTDPMLRVPVDDLQEAWQLALQRGLSITPRADDPSGGAYVARPVSDVPGFWRMNDAGHLAVLITIRNDSPVRLAPGKSEMRAIWDRPYRSLDLRCGLMTKAPGIAPGASAPMYCVATAMPPDIHQWPDRWTWLPPRLVTDDEVTTLADAHSAPASTAALDVRRRNSRCVAQDNCSEAQLAAIAQSQQAQAAARAADVARWEKERQEADRRAARTKRRNALLLAAALIAGQVVFVVLARLTGSWIPPSLLVMGGAGVLSSWFWRAAQEAGRDSFAPLVLAVLAAGAIAGGACLCAVYAMVHRLFFAPRD